MTLVVPHAAASTSKTSSLYTELQKWLIEDKGMPKQLVEPRTIDSEFGPVVGCVATEDIAMDSVRYIFTIWIIMLNFGTGSTFDEQKPYRSLVPD